MDHECPKTGCGEQMPSHLLACRPHWYSIPKPVRDELNRAWKVYQKALNGSGESVVPRRVYIEARHAAVTCLNA